MAQTGKVGGSGPLCTERHGRYGRRQLRPGRILDVAWRLAQIPCRAAPPQRALACPCLLEWRVGNWCAERPGVCEHGVLVTQHKR